MRRATFARIILLIALIGVVTIMLQVWLGGYTLYSPVNAPGRAAMHEYILHNRLPAGVQWDDLGASNGLNIRIGVVFLAEGLRRALNVPVLRVYFLIDTVALGASLLLLFVFLRQWYGVAYSLIGLLYFSSVLPLSYVLHYFQPWDRISLSLWIMLLLLLRAGHMKRFALLLALSITVKYDTVLLPGLYWLWQVSRANWRRVTAMTGLLFGLSLGTYALLILARPGGFQGTSVIRQLGINVRDLQTSWKSYPPALVFTVPILLAWIGFRNADRFIKASVIFGMLLFVPFILATNFREVRPQIPILVLLLPGALRGLERIIGEAEQGKERLSDTA